MSDPKYDKLKEENYWMYQYEVALKDDHERLRKAIEEMEPVDDLDDFEDFGDTAPFDM